MKNILKYSFSVLIMASCVIAVGIGAFKILVIDERAVELPEESAINGKNEIIEDTEEKSKPKPEDAPFIVSDKNYMQDALFIGDSRTMGLWQYGQIEGADFFANTGMNVYNVKEKRIDVPGVGNISLEELFAKKNYGKIYLMLGINELGYNRDNTVNEYGNLVNWIKEKEPNSIVYIEANLHVAASRSESDDIFNNANIDEFNQRISEFIDNKKVFYIDVNKIFDDENGNLGEEYTSDNTHVLGKYYVVWADWLLTKSIAPDSDNI